MEGEQKLMVTVERCEGLKKESGVFGGSVGMMMMIMKVVVDDDDES